MRQSMKGRPWLLLQWNLFMEYFVFLYNAGWQLGLQSLHGGVSHGALS